MFAGIDAVRLRARRSAQILAEAQRVDADIDPMTGEEDASRGRGRSEHAKIGDRPGPGGLRRPPKLIAV